MTSPLRDDDYYYTPRVRRSTQPGERRYERDDRRRSVRGDLRLVETPPKRRISKRRASVFAMLTVFTLMIMGVGLRSIVANNEKQKLNSDDTSAVEREKLRDARNELAQINSLENVSAVAEHEGLVKNRDTKSQSADPIDASAFSEGDPVGNPSSAAGKYSQSSYTQSGQSQQSQYGQSQYIQVQQSQHGQSSTQAASSGNSTGGRIG